MLNDELATAVATPSDVDPTDSRKQRERENRRAHVLNVARDLFSRKGFDATTMAEVAAGSEFAVGTLYKFFKDKHDLYQALVGDTVREFERELVAALESHGPPVERINRFIDVGSEMFFRHLPMTRVYFGHTAAAFVFAPAGLEDESYLSYRRIVHALENVLREGVERGVFVNIEPSVLAMGLEGVHNSFLGVLVREPNAFTPAQIADYTKRMFFGSVLKK